MKRGKLKLEGGQVYWRWWWWSGHIYISLRTPLPPGATLSPVKNLAMSVSLACQGSPRARTTLLVSTWPRTRWWLVTAGPPLLVTSGQTNTPSPTWLSPQQANKTYSISQRKTNEWKDPVFFKLHFWLADDQLPGLCLIVRDILSKQTFHKPPLKAAE